MKIPFPYRLEAEFYLFHPPPKKVTAIHLLIVIFPTGASTLTFLFLRDAKANTVASAVVAVLIFCALIAVLYQLCCSFLPLLMNVVDHGIVQEPDMAKWEKQIRSNAGWK
jgi:hypothetical protein